MPEPESSRRLSPPRSTNGGQARPTATTASSGERGDVRVPHSGRGAAGRLPAAATGTRPRPRRRRSSTALDDARARFLRAHADDVYAALTDDLQPAVRDEELVYAAAERFPGLVPTRAQMAAERERPWPTRRASRSRRACSSRSCSRRRAAARTSSGRCCARPRRRSNASTSSGRPASPISAARYLERRGQRRVSRDPQRPPPERRGLRHARRPPRSPSTWRCSTPRSRSA